MSNLRFRTALLGSGAAIALMAASVPASADELNELKGQIEALQSKLATLEINQIAAQQEQQYVAAPANAVVGGDKPGSFRLPGSNTSVAIGGYAKLDLIYDFSKDVGDSFSPEGIALSSPGPNAGNMLGDNFTPATRRLPLQTEQRCAPLPLQSAHFFSRLLPATVCFPSLAQRRHAKLPIPSQPGQIASRSGSESWPLPPQYQHGAFLVLLQTEHSSVWSLPLQRVHSRTFDPLQEGQFFGVNSSHCSRPLSSSLVARSTLGSAAFCCWRAWAGIAPVQAIRDTAPTLSSNLNVRIGNTSGSEW